MVELTPGEMVELSARAAVRADERLADREREVQDLRRALARAEFTRDTARIRADAALRQLVRAREAEAKDEQARVDRMGPWEFMDRLLPAFPTGRSTLDEAEG